MLEREQREALRRACEEFEAIPFPAGSTNEEAAELHAELVLCDGWIAGLLASLVGGASPSQEIRFDGDLEARLRRCAAADDPLAASDAKRYLDYLGRIRELVELADSYQRPGA